MTINEYQLLLQIPQVYNTLSFYWQIFGSNDMLFILKHEKRHRLVYGHMNNSTCPALHVSESCALFALRTIMGDNNQMTFKPVSILFVIIVLNFSWTRLSRCLSRQLGISSCIHEYCFTGDVELCLQVCVEGKYNQRYVGRPWTNPLSLC